MLFSRAPRLLWRSFKYLVYIAPWASAWGAFRFKAGFSSSQFAKGSQNFTIATKCHNGTCETVSHVESSGVQVSSGLRPRTRAGDFKFFQVLAPLCGPLQRDFRAFPAGMIPFPALPVKAGFSALCGVMPTRPRSRKSGLQMRRFIVWVQDIRDIPPCV